MTAWYNEPDPHAAAWLRNLINAGLIAPGIVDERPIQEIEAFELAGFTQCHFFAGIGIWSAALRAVGWSDDAPIWTGSCPCQPFSNAGKRKGTDDERHLWPTWFNLIKICKPAIVVGEQVASKDGLGWFDLVSTDLEGASYAIGASDLCAAGFGQAHIRQRLYFVGLADAAGGNASAERQQHGGQHRLLALCDDPGGLEHGGNKRLEGLAWDGDARDQSGWLGAGETRSVTRASANGGVAYDHEQQRNRGGIVRPRGRLEFANGDSTGARIVLRSRETGSLDDADWLLCRNPAGEPSWRPVEPGTFPLAYGITDRMGKLRAYGNALDFKTAQGFCEVIADIVGA